MGANRPGHPADATLGSLKSQPKLLLHGHRAGARDACERIRATHARLASLSPQEVRQAPFALADALLVIARERGYESWPKLVCQEHDDQPQFANEPGDLLGVYQWFGLLYGTSGDQRTALEIHALLQDAGLQGWSPDRSTAISRLWSAGSHRRQPLRARPGSFRQASSALPPAGPVELALAGGRQLHQRCNILREREFVQPWRSHRARRTGSPPISTGMRRVCSCAGHGSTNRPSSACHGCP